MWATAFSCDTQTLVMGAEGDIGIDGCSCVVLNMALLLNFTAALRGRLVSLHTSHITLALSTFIWQLNT